MDDAIALTQYFSDEHSAFFSCTQNISCHPLHTFSSPSAFRNFRNLISLLSFSAPMSFLLFFILEERRASTSQKASFQSTSSVLPTGLTVSHLTAPSVHPASSLRPKTSSSCSGTPLFNQKRPWRFSILKSYTSPFSYCFNALPFCLPRSFYT